MLWRVKVSSFPHLFWRFFDQNPTDGGAGIAPAPVCQICHDRASFREIFVTRLVCSELYITGGHKKVIQYEDSVFWEVNTASLDERYRPFQNSYCLQLQVGRESSVGIATRYGLDGPGIESRWGAGFSAPALNGPGDHPASYTIGTGSFPGVKRPGRGVDHPPHLAPWLRKRRATPHFPLFVFVAFLGWTLPSASKVKGWLLDPWRWRHHEPPKSGQSFTQRQSVGSQTLESSATPQRQPRFL